MEIDRDMLPMKGHYFLFNAGTAPLVPYLPTYAKQLGFSTYIVGILYTILPVLGLIVKPLLGAIADSYAKHKTFFIAFQVLTIAAFTGLYFIPQTEVTPPKVDLACGNGETFFGVCTQGNVSINQFELRAITSENTMRNCEMSCKIENPMIWESICQDWKIPNYCFDNYDDFSFTMKTKKSDIKIQNECVTIPVGAEVIYNGEPRQPVCYENLYKNYTTKSMLYCEDKLIDTFLKENSNLSTSMRCDNKSLVFDACLNKSSNTTLDAFINSLKEDSNVTNCNVNCKRGETQKWLEMCDLKQFGDVICQPVGTSLPEEFNFVAQVPTNKILTEKNCVYFKIQNVLMFDGTRHYPTCANAKSVKHHFHSDCYVTCLGRKMNELIASTSGGSEINITTEQIVWFFLLMSLNWIGMAVVVSIGDAICFVKLGANSQAYGRQRLWGSVGWGVLSLTTGLLIDHFSKDSEYKNYAIAFVLMAVFLGLDIAVSVGIKYKQMQLSTNILSKISTVFSSWRIYHFFAWIIFIGMCTGLVWQFLFWYLEDLAKESSWEQFQYIKTLQGLVSGLQCFAGEIPFFFFSGPILKKIGHMHSMSLVLFCFGLRLLAYSLLSNPWYVLPIELLQGVTFGMFYATMASYASILADGTEGTLQGLVGAVFEGVGVSLGSFIGGLMYSDFGGALTFRIFGGIAAVLFILNVVLSILCAKEIKPDTNQDYSSIVHYATPDDAITLTDN